MKLPNVLILVGMFILSACGKSQTMDSVKSTLRPEVSKLASSIADQGSEHIHMPPLPLKYSADRYHNTSPQDLSSTSLKGKVVLLDIWDYTCVNCIRTLPYIKSWAEKYKDKGLVVIGVHSPEFDFEKAPENLKAAIKKFALNYPVIADNEYEIWNSLANKYWPAKYLFDANGILRASHFGEGEYQEYESFIQKILLERDSSVVLPNLSEVVRASDKAGSVCYKPTPETYIGYSRNHLGNTEAEKHDVVTQFHAPTSLKEDMLYLDGEWKVGREFATPSGNGNSHFLINYQAKEVNLVIHPQQSSGFKVWVEQSDRVVPNADRGADLFEENGKTFILVDQARMYNIVNNSAFGHHTLRLTSDNPSFGAYAFTFTTDCMAE
ncbi:MAG: redoxin domain-containing protein [bacterium]